MYFFIESNEMKFFFCGYLNYELIMNKKFIIYIENIEMISNL